MKFSLRGAKNALSKYFRRKTYFGDSETQPVSDKFGVDRGTPIDRYFIEQFLQQNSRYIKGSVLEIAESTYSKRFGSAVTSYEVLHAANDNPNATIVGDLSQPQTLPTNTVDCFICTQTFNFIYNFQDAIKGAWQLLKPGGVLIATVAGVTQISRYDMDRWGDYWRFTTASAKKAFGDVFGEQNVTIDYHGNCYTAVCFLRGLCLEEIKKENLLAKAPDYPVIITILAQKEQTR
jgi:hypothetical protein